MAQSERAFSFTCMDLCLDKLTTFMNQYVIAHRLLQGKQIQPSDK